MQPARIVSAGPTDSRGNGKLGRVVPALWLVQFLPEAPYVALTPAMEAGITDHVWELNGIAFRRAYSNVCITSERNWAARSSLQLNRREMSMIPTSLDEALSLFRKWAEEKTRLRFVAALKSLTVSVDCSVLSASETELKLLLPGKTVGGCVVGLADCDIFFGADDVPGAEREVLKMRFDAGVSVFTPNAESFWLVEVLEV